MAVMFFMVFWVVLSKYSISLWFIPRLNAADRLSVRWKNKKKWCKPILYSYLTISSRIKSYLTRLRFDLSHFSKKIFDNFQNFVNTDKKFSFQLLSKWWNSIMHCHVLRESSEKFSLKVETFHLGQHYAYWYEHVCFLF